MRHISQEEYPLLRRITVREEVVVQHLERKLALLDCAGLFIHIDGSEYDL